MKTLAFFFALMSPALARLGETVEECRTRYGKETHVEESISGMTFVKAGFTIMAVFSEGRVGWMRVYHSAETNLLGTSAEITEAELTTFLDANRGGSKWVKKELMDFVNTTWVSEDGKRIAIYDTLKHTLDLSTVAFAEKSAKKKAEEEKKNLDGF